MLCVNEGVVIVISHKKTIVWRNLEVALEFYRDQSVG